MTSPATTPSGRRRPPVAPAESAIGSTGTTQGDTAVAAPATNPKMISRSIRQKPSRTSLRKSDAHGSAARRDRGDRAGGELRHGAGAAVVAGDAVVLADRQLVLAQERPGRVDHRGAAQP